MRVLSFSSTLYPSRVYPGTYEIFLCFDSKLVQKKKKKNVREKYSVNTKNSNHTCIWYQIIRFFLPSASTLCHLSDDDTLFPRELAHKSNSINLTSVTFVQYGFTDMTDISMHAFSPLPIHIFHNI